jgi:hypothetical protein
MRIACSGQGEVLTAAACTNKRFQGEPSDNHLHMNE